MTGRSLLRRRSPPLVGIRSARNRLVFVGACYAGDRLRSRLLQGIWLFFLCLATGATADPRELRITDSEGQELRLPVAQLEADFGMRTATVFDPQYGAVRSYRGIALRPLLDSLGLGADDLVLECIDGYRIALTAQSLADPQLEPLLALADTAPTAGRHWLLLEHGRELVDFDPFYLVWSVRDMAPEQAAEDPRVARLPWPYQLTRIVPEADYLPPAPAGDVPESVVLGYGTYVDHCLKCHSLEGRGGVLGPPLDRPGGMVGALDNARLRALIYRVTDVFPKTKMPVYESTLSARQLDALVAYLRWQITAL